MNKQLPLVSSYFFLQPTDYTSFTPAYFCPPFTISGTTRDNFDGKKVLRLEYEAYVPMAKTEMKKLCQAIRTKWEVEHIAVLHRIGYVISTICKVEHIAVLHRIGYVISSRPRRNICFLERSEQKLGR